MSGIVKKIQKLIASVRGGGADEIHIGVIGPPGAGKTTLIQMLQEAVIQKGQSVGVRLAWRHNNVFAAEHAPPTEGVNHFEVTATVHEGRNLTVKIFDAMGGMLEGARADGVSADDPLDALVRASDLLILALPSHSLGDDLASVTNSMLHYVSVLLAGRSDASVVIAYTRFDELCPPSVGEPRLISTSEQRVAYRRYAITLRDSDATPEAKSDSWSTLLETLDPSQDETGQLVTSIVARTEPLWRALAQKDALRLSPSSFNAYLVAARPADRMLDSWARRGLLQIFADFFQVVRETRSRPRLATWARAAVFVLIALFAGGMVAGTSEHEMDERLRSISKAGNEAAVETENRTRKEGEELSAGEARGWRIKQRWNVVQGYGTPWQPWRDDYEKQFFLALHMESDDRRRDFVEFASGEVSGEVDKCHDALRRLLQGPAGDGDDAIQEMANVIHTLQGGHFARPSLWKTVVHAPGGWSNPEDPWGTLASVLSRVGDVDVTLKLKLENAPSVAGGQQLILILHPADRSDLSLASVAIDFQLAAVKYWRSNIEYVPGMDLVRGEDTTGPKDWTNVEFSTLENFWFGAYEWLRVDLSHLPVLVPLGEGFQTWKTDFGSVGGDEATQLKKAADTVIIERLTQDNFLVNSK